MFPGVGMAQVVVLKTNVFAYLAMVEIDVKTCALPISAICNETCVHGICAEPYTCFCQPGWNGTYCEERMSNSNEFLIG